MSKDRGTKNIKKAPADKSKAKVKISDYKSETKSSTKSSSGTNSMSDKSGEKN